ncbi:MAG: hypothetical protein AABX08_00755 [Nanoarchaeota archaeon]
MKYNSIIISGLPLTGKSTLAKELSKVFNWKIHSVGNLFKKKWHTLYPNQEISFEQYWRNTSLEENKQIDEATKKLFEKENLIGDFRYSICYKNLNVLLVLVTADLNIRIKRAQQSERYLGKSYDEIKNILLEREKDEVTKGKLLYGENYDFRNPNNYHLTLDLGKLTTEEAVKIIKKVVNFNAD